MTRVRVNVSVAKLDEYEQDFVVEKLDREQRQISDEPGYSACVLGPYTPKHRCYYGRSGHVALKRLAAAMARAGLLD